MKSFCSVFLFVSFVFAANDSLYSEAQKLYSQGKFEAAAKMHADACSNMDGQSKKICLFNEVKALVETGKADLAANAEPKLLLLMSQTEPGDSLFTWLNMEDAKLQTMLGNPVRAVRSWNAAQASASPDYFSELFVICNDIISAYPTNGLSSENCNKIKPSDTTIISLPRKKITPLATAPNPQAKTQNSKPQTSNSNQWYVQLGAFGSKENAERLAEDFNKRGVQLYIMEIKDRKLFSVRTGYFSSSNDASLYAEQKIAPAHKDYKIYKD